MRKRKGFLAFSKMADANNYTIFETSTLISR